MSDSLFIIEDEKVLSGELSRYFDNHGWEVERAGDLAGAKHKLVDESYEPTVVLADLQLRDGNSLDLLEAMRRKGLTGEWVLMTGPGGTTDSTKAISLGAYDLLEKPCDIERLGAVLNSARRSARAYRQLREQRDAGIRDYSPNAFAGRSEAAQQVRHFLERLKDVPFSSLVIGGETGCGKGLVARILHHAGPRSNAPLVEVNCAALPRDLLESELFGHEPGAFTGAKGRHRGYLEQADGGTLFLDEIVEMDVDLQSKLLTAIEDRMLRRLGGEKPIRVDVQVIAASNQDLESRVREGRFRSDLYHRLSVFRLDLPPLRERLEDLEALVPPMLAEFNASAGRSVRVVPAHVYHKLRSYDWPGNVRELRNVIERGVLLSEGNLFSERWLQLGSRLGREPTGPTLEGNRLMIPLDGSMALDEMDSYIIQVALEQNGFNVAATARSLGTTRETLRYRIEKYCLRTRASKADPLMRKIA